MLYLSIGLLVLVYVGLRLLLVSHFGRVLVGIRENERRIDLLGYDSRRYKLAAFVLAAGIAALAGVLYARLGQFRGARDVQPPPGRPGRDLGDRRRQVDA